ncbi:hypothetical protein FACS189487_00770 [Campylobacterota bacterium]|nr:hypothetical protein FACS189487_00770 [Campylobacterota bacterium]
MCASIYQIMNKIENLNKKRTSFYNAKANAEICIIKCGEKIDPIFLEAKDNAQVSIEKCSEKIRLLNMELASLVFPFDKRIVNA